MARYKEILGCASDAMLSDDSRREHTMAVTFLASELSHELDQPPSTVCEALRGGAAKSWLSSVEAKAKDKAGISLAGQARTCSADEGSCRGGFVMHALGECVPEEWRYCVSSRDGDFADLTDGTYQMASEAGREGFLAIKAWIEENSAGFDGKNYRLGNLIDKWWSYRVCRGEVYQGKIAHDFEDILGRAPRNSFGLYLWEHRNESSADHGGNIQLNSLIATAYEDTFLTFWIYEYSAISTVLAPLRIALREAIEGYSKSIGHVIPEVAPGTCVIHYRLGDMLSVGVLDPIHMAQALYMWSLQHGREDSIRRFEVLAAGLGHGSSVELSQSRQILNVFLHAVQSLFPGVSISVETEGTPDDDWFKMITAPFLFTSHGSYAISAAVVRLGPSATPAVLDTNFLDCGSMSPGYFTQSWYLYACRNLRPAESRVIRPPTEGPRCVQGNVTYSCCDVQGWKVTSRRTPSPHPLCLGGMYSWGNCLGGKFLCPDAASDARGVVQQQECAEHTR